MANMKTASVNVRIQEDIKKQAEEILKEIERDTKEEKENEEEGTN
mgnify:CR=1 FL=1